MTRKELYDVIRVKDLTDYIKKETGLHYTNVKTAELEKLLNNLKSSLKKTSKKEANNNKECVFNEKHHDGLLEIVKNINEEIARLMNIRDALTREAEEFGYHVLNIPF